MIDTFKAWLDVHHLDVFYYAVLWFFLPATIQLMIKPPPGSKAEQALGMLASWGFDAEKFFRKLGELLEASRKSRGSSRIAAVILAALLGVACSGVLKSPAVQAGELVLHAADQSCGVVALLHDDAADAVCLVVKELDALDAHLAEAETAQAAAPLVVVAKDGSARRMRVKREHVGHARRAVVVARQDVSP